jgi:hypothetical protein
MSISVDCHSSLERDFTERNRLEDATVIRGGSLESKPIGGIDFSIGLLS